MRLRFWDGCVFGMMMRGACVAVGEDDDRDRMVLQSGRFCLGGVLC